MRPTTLREEVLLMNVYFKPINYYKNQTEEVVCLINKSEIFSNISSGDYVAVKLHIGEIGNQNYINPTLVRAVIEKIKEKNAIPFLTDTTTLYKNKRYDATCHIDTALRHGFSFFATGAPFIVADGLGFEDGIKLESKGMLPETYMASIFSQCNFLVVLSHCKGHHITSFGGAIKNIGMGCVTRRTKLAIHRLADFAIDTDKCDGCGICADVCPGHYPSVINEKMINTNEDCMRCRICEIECPKGAISTLKIENVSKGLVSATEAVLKNFKEKAAFINFGINISHLCDCFADPGRMISRDIGYFASNDIVAVDKAFLDKCGIDVFKNEFKIDPLVQISEAEKLKIGLGKYNLIEI